MNFRFCPRCGGPLQVETIDHQPVPRCQQASCSFIFWQNSKPCTVGLLPDAGGRLLLTVRGIAPEIGKLDLPGGFLRKGEHPVAGLQRELAEELGIQTRPVAYFDAFIDEYGDTEEHVLILGFVVAIEKGTPQAKEEITDLVWKEAAAIDQTQLAFTNNAWFLQEWAKRRQEFGY